MRWKSSWIRPKRTDSKELAEYYVIYEYGRYYDNDIFHTLSVLCVLFTFNFIEDNHQITKYQEGSRSKDEYKHSVR